MIYIKDLESLSEARLADAKVLCEAGRFDGAVYLCGYAVELKLKARICKTLAWEGFPETNREFQHYKSFKTHHLDVLLSLTGVEAHIKAENLAEWSAVASWDPTARYNPAGNVDRGDAELMMDAAETLLAVL